MPWSELGLAPTIDERAIRRAYAARLKQTRPEDDSAGFARLRAAYEEALNWARWQAHQAKQAEAAHAQATPAEFEEAPPEDAPSESSPAEFDAAPPEPSPAEVESPTDQPAPVRTVLWRADTPADAPARLPGDAVPQAEPAVRTVWWREQVDHQELDPAYQALRRAAQERDYPEAELEADAQRFGWLEIERPQPGPADWLTQARFRLYHLYAGRLLGLLADSGNEDAALARLPEALQWPIWEMLDARHVLEHGLVNWLTGFEQTPLRLTAALADWAGWLDAEGYPLAGLPRPVLWLCQRLRQESVWQAWQAEAHRQHAPAKKRFVPSRWDPFAAEPVRQRQADKDARFRTAVFAAVFLPQASWRRWFSARSGKLAQAVNGLLNEIEYGWPELFGRLDPAMLTFWRGPQAAWASPPGWVWVPAVLVGLFWAGVIQGLAQLVTGDLFGAALLGWLLGMSGGVLGTLWLANQARFHWPRWVQRQAERLTSLAHALGNGFQPLLAGGRYLLLASVVVFLAVAFQDLDPAWGWASLPLAAGLLAADFAARAWPDRIVPAVIRRARAAGLRLGLGAGAAALIGLVCGVLGRAQQAVPTPLGFWLPCLGGASLSLALLLAWYARRPAVAPKPVSEQAGGRHWWWLVWTLIFVSQLLARYVKEAG